jgi:hypothetical protein
MGQEEENQNQKEKEQIPKRPGLHSSKNQLPYREDSR